MKILKTLRAQLTNCKKIFALKEPGTKVLASISNFEHAIGIGEISSNKKTETIYEIMNSSLKVDIKGKIDSLR